MAEELEGAEQQDQGQTAEQQDQGQADEQQNLPEYGVNVEDVGTLKKKVTVKVPAERIEAKRNEMFGELGNTAQVPGFRIGHAPRRLLEKRFGKEISSDVRNGLIGESLGKAIEKADLKVLGEPDLDLDKIEMPESGDLEYSFVVEIQPNFELPELKGIKVNKPKIEATDERINEYIENLRRGRGRYEDTDDAAAAEDVVLAGAKISGEGIETVERHGLTLRVAPGQVEGLPLVDLGTALAGKKAGETAELSITVPDAHPNEAWRGKQVKIDISISQVRRQVLPEVNDEWAKSLGFESLDELRNYVKERLADRLAAEQRRSMRDQVCSYLLDNTKFDLPEGAIQRSTAKLLQRRYVDLLQMGVTRERIEENLTQLQASAQEEAQRELRLSFVLGRIADDEKIEVTEGEVNSQIAAMASMHNRRPERLRQDLESEGRLEQVLDAMREDKAIESLLEKAEITEVEPEANDKE